MGDYPTDSCNLLWFWQWNLVVDHLIVSHCVDSDGLLAGAMSLKLAEIVTIVLHLPKHYILGLPESTG